MNYTENSTKYLSSQEQGGQYASQAGHYPRQPSYPVQAGYSAPPQYSGSAPYPQQPPLSPSMTNAVVQEPQPNAVYTTKPVNDYHFNMSVGLTYACLLMGTWCSLFCTVPAILVAKSAIKSDTNGDIQSAKTKGKIALALNIMGIVWGGIVILAMIVAAGILISI